MTPIDFIHLRLHSEFSLVDSTVRIKPLMKSLQERNMPAIALADLSNMCGMIKFYKAAQGAGIKAICGCDIYLAADPKTNVPLSRMTLLVMNHEGYRNLTALVSLSYQHGQDDGKAIVQRQWLQAHQAGLIALSGANYGEVGYLLISRGQAEAQQALAYWVNLFGDRFYLELQRTSRPNDETCVAQSVTLARTMNIPVVATNDVMFVDESDFDAHETRVCITQSRTLDDATRPKEYSSQQYLKTPQEMQQLFADIPSALTNTVEIAKRCNLDIVLGKESLPEFPVPEGITVDEYLRQVSKQGLESRLKNILDPEQDDYEARRQEFIERLDFELDVIIDMGFPGYFLIVMDFIRWAKDNAIPVGPGRGSGAGSLVAYALSITDLDPLQYGLLFERFLNPERVSMPDFDIDFCMDNRDRVIEYVAQTYGKDAVSQIITFGTMAAKAVVRDVARVQGKPFGLADKLSKLIPFEVGITLTKALEQDDALREFVAGNESVQEIMDMAMQLEGLTRNLGKHAGGVVIAPTKLVDFSPLYCDTDGSGLVTQYDKGDVEDVGLVKFDFLGLRTLTIIDWAVAMINQQRQDTQQAPLNIDTIDLEDNNIYKLLQRGETTGVFQLESRGMKDLIQRLLPSTFEDIIALVALFRPGPLQSGMVDDFINRKHGRADIAYPHEDYQLDSLKPVLEPTYGIILYQEQVMQIARVMAGFSLGGADQLRRAMGKKNAEEMAKQRSIFIEGSVKNSIDENLAKNIFGLVEMFAGYGFNKSHSAAYALVSYQTAWLKYHYPAQFMAAVFSSEMQTTDKVVVLVEETKNMGLSLVLPNINLSYFKFTVNAQGQVVYGLGAVKGVGEGPVASIIEARNRDGEFTDIFDFCLRVGSKKLNKRVLEALVACGAFDDLVPNGNRAILYQAIPDAMRAADQNERNDSAGMVDMFADLGAAQTSNSVAPYFHYHNTKELTLGQRLMGEKNTLGMYLSGHPVDEYRGELAKFTSSNLKKITIKREDQWLAGQIVALRTMKTKKGKTIAFVTLDDGQARIDIGLFQDSYDKYRDKLQTDKILVVKGEVGNDDYSGGLRVRAKEILTLAQARTVFARCLRIKVTTEQLQKHGLTPLQMILGRCQVTGDAPSTRLEITYQNQQAIGTMRCASPWRLALEDDLLDELRQLLGSEAVELVYAH